MLIDAQRKKQLLIIILLLLLVIAGVVLYNFFLFGKIKMVGIEGSDIIIRENGQHYQTGDITANLRAGEYTLFVVKDKYKTEEKRVRVFGGKTTEEDVSLIPLSEEEANALPNKANNSGSNSNNNSATINSGQASSQGSGASNQAEQFYQGHPLVAYLPYEGHQFYITYDIVNDKYKILVNNPLGGQQDPEEDKITRLAIKNSAVEWIYSKGVDPDKINIEWDGVE